MPKQDLAATRHAPSAGTRLNRDAAFADAAGLAHASANDRAGSVWIADGQGTLFPPSDHVRLGNGFLSLDPRESLDASGPPAARATISYRRSTMASIVISEIEAQLEKRALFNVRLICESGRFDFPVGIADQGSIAANAIAVLNAARGLGEQLAAAAKQQLDPPPRA